MPKYIIQKDSINQEGYAFTVAKIHNWDLPLEQHPWVVNRPDIFEVVELNSLPTFVQYVTDDIDLP
jgi:hypothetical protein